MSGSPPHNDALKARLDRRYFREIPHNRALGLKVVGYRAQWLSLALPYHEKLIGNPDTGVLHGGCITTLIDAACVGAVVISLTDALRVATLDLRIDYLRPGEPQRDVICDALCYKVTRHIAFFRATAHHGDETNSIAMASGTCAIFPQQDSLLIEGTSS